LIRVGIDENDEDLSHHYKQLLTKIKFNDAHLNVKIKSGEIIYQSSIDILVDKCVNGKERTVVIMQYVKTSTISYILIGVLAIEIKSDKRSFAVDQSEIKNNQSKVELFLIFA